jgi:subtilisin family serine protease
MSLGGSLKSRTEETAFASAYTNGTLSIAAAGNDGNSRVSYPAGYASVISVAAVDESNVVASFSQYNSDVEIAAPGVGVLSTVPVGSGLAATVTVGSTYDAEPMDGSPKLSKTGPLVDCGLGGTACPKAVDGKSGQVCLIQRGTYDFATKVQNCQAGGGTAAIIYNNTTGPLLGTLGGVSTNIPSVGISQADGVALMAKLGTSATVSVEASSYAKFDGTSMATPHVSGVAALVWGEQTSCTNAQIRNALNSSALPLGAAGRDVYYGYGLVQRKAALDYLIANPCSGGGGGGGGGTKPGKGK